VYGLLHAQNFRRERDGAMTNSKPSIATTGIAANVRAEAARHDRTQLDLAELLGITHSAISRRMRGETPFRDYELQSIAEYLGVSIATLFAVSREDGLSA
jgi:transcriptional regulator with XRE-family HTH domain